MSICSTTGLVVAEYCLFEGRKNDSAILIEIFEDKHEVFKEFLEMVKANDCLFIMDRGFEHFISWVKTKRKNDPSFYPQLEMVMPCKKTDKETKQYEKEPVNYSRSHVTAIKFIVENLHAWEKLFLMVRVENKHSFLTKHFGILNFVAASLNYFGYRRKTGKTCETFTALEKFNLLTKEHPMIFDSHLNGFLMTNDHALNYRKRQNWTELNFSQISNIFPDVTVRDIQTLTGGPYLLHKALGYVSHVCEVLKERENLRKSRGMNDTISTSTMSTRGVYRTLVMDGQLPQKYIQAQKIIRVDIPSFYSSARKFIAVIGIRSNENGHKLSFGCSCSTGGRTTPCVHNVLVCYLFGFKLKTVN